MLRLQCQYVVDRSSIVLAMFVISDSWLINTLKRISNWPPSFFVNLRKSIRTKIQIT